MTRGVTGGVTGGGDAGAGAGAGAGHGAGPSTGPEAVAARAAFRELVDAKGHAVENARTAAAGLEAALEAGTLVRTDPLARMLGDLAVALEPGDGQKLGGKSAEAARFILRAIGRELENA